MAEREHMIAALQKGARLYAERHEAIIGVSRETGDVAYWRGKRIDDLTSSELSAAVAQMVRMLNDQKDTIRRLSALGRRG